jgi:hypothetical protein
LPSPISGFGQRRAAGDDAAVVSDDSTESEGAADVSGETADADIVGDARSAPGLVDVDVAGLPPPHPASSRTLAAKPITSRMGGL